MGDADLVRLTILFQTYQTQRSTDNRASILFALWRSGRVTVTLKGWQRGINADGLAAIINIEISIPIEAGQRGQCIEFLAQRLDRKLLEYSFPDVRYAYSARLRVLDGGSTVCEFRSGAGRTCESREATNLDR